MKRLFLYGVLLVGFFFALPTLYAQEMSFPKEEPQKEKSYYSSSYDDEYPDYDSTDIQPGTVITDHQSDAASSKQQGKKEDDDVLSFNFLYYIIQKFKMSDIVNQ